MNKLVASDIAQTIRRWGWVDGQTMSMPTDRLYRVLGKAGFSAAAITDALNEASTAKVVSVYPTYIETLR